jgi:chorismate mutase
MGVSVMSEHAEDARDQIEDLRAKIDEIDCAIVHLLNERAGIALRIREFKPEANLSLYDPKREEEIFSNLARCNEGPLYADNLREIYEAILHVMKEL